jgi:hypothetical protein
MSTIRADWPRGKQFRVVQSGAWLSGMVPIGVGNAYQGWRQDLSIGDVITCLGFSPGWGSDPGYGIHFTTEQAEQARACFVEFRPMAGGLFDYHPMDGWLESVFTKFDPATVRSERGK